LRPTRRRSGCLCSEPSQSDERKGNRPGLQGLVTFDRQRYSIRTIPRTNDLKSYSLDDHRCSGVARIRVRLELRRSGYWAVSSGPRLTSNRACWELGGVESGATARRARRRQFIQPLRHDGGHVFALCSQCPRSVLREGHRSLSGHPNSPPAHTIARVTGMRVLSLRSSFVFVDPNRTDQGTKKQ
jgi:hypothetical protein